MIRISEGTAAAVGLSRAVPETHPTTAYVLLGDRCLENCAFCAQARGVPEKEKNRLGRVFWPAFRWEELEPSLAQFGKDTFDRICLQAVRNSEGLQPLLQLLHYFRTHTSLPVSVSARVEEKEEVLALLEAGAEKINISLDAASEEACRKVKNDSLPRRLDFLLECAREWPQCLSTHLICGLGESEKDLLQLAALLLQHNVTLGLFAFTPLRGTPLSGCAPPPPARYRRIQAALQLLKTGAVPFSSLQFEKGKLVSFGLSPAELFELLQEGRAFQTSGCPGCNRPYYNERPGGFLYNYPRPLTTKEAEKALEDICSSLAE